MPPQRSVNREQGGQAIAPGERVLTGGVEDCELRDYRYSDFTRLQVDFEAGVAACGAITTLP